MFDIGAAELLVIVITAIVVIGPKEMPRALRTAFKCLLAVCQPMKAVASSSSAFVCSASSVLNFLSSS